MSVYGGCGVVYCDGVWGVQCMVMMGGLLRMKMDEWTYLVQSLPEGEDWGELSGPGLPIKLSLHVSHPGDHLQLGDDMRAYCTLARSLNVGRETKE